MLQAVSLQGDWLFDDSINEFTISGSKLIKTAGHSVGKEYIISELTSSTFKISGGYGGGSATYTAAQISFQNGELAIKKDMPRTAWSTGCSSIKDSRQCCLHTDGRSNEKYRGEDCVPAAHGMTFTSGNVCEPHCWTE